MNNLGHNMYSLCQSLARTLFKDVLLSSEHMTRNECIGHHEQRALGAKDEKNTWVTTEC